LRSGLRTIDAKRLGARIRQLREERKLTQEKLAYECGRAKSYVCEIEAGKKLPSLMTLSEFAERLEVSLYDLLVFPNSGVREQLIEATRGVPTTALEELVKSAFLKK
jgi:transcriptional regulator with XRE-family HTH domain